MYKILFKKVLNKDVDLMVIEAPLVAKNTEPGHFIILRVNEEGERIPLTIVDSDINSVTIIYQKLGYSTNLLGTLNVGDSIFDFVGPLGKAAHIREVKSIIGIAGGVGAAPLFPQLKEYKKRGVNVDLILGGRSKDYLLLIDEYKEFCDNIYYCTDDGSFGFKGFVTDLALDLYKTKTYDQSIAIGPLIMMKNVVLLNKKFNLPTDVSLNPIMIDGTGMCGNCRVTINGKTFFACVDGPDFPGEGVNFDELMTRQKYYKEEEHICNLELMKNEDS
jgi:ferredoxin--NADP+ reductase